MQQGSNPDPSTSCCVTLGKLLTLPVPTSRVGQLWRMDELPNCVQLGEQSSAQMQREGPGSEGNPSPTTGVHHEGGLGWEGLDWRSAWLRG